jgi:hypothetical protein
MRGVAYTGRTMSTPPLPATDRPKRWGFIGKVIASPRPSESQKRFGVRLALYGSIPFMFAIMLILAFVPVDVDAEWGIAYWLFIGVIQWIYLLPGAVLALALRRRQLAKGLLLGGAIVAGLNLGAWGLGLALNRLGWR